MSENVQIRDLLTNAGLVLRDEGKMWRTKATYRGGSNSNSIAIYKNSGVWHDYGAGLFSQPFEKLLDLIGSKGVDLSNIARSPDIPQIEEPQVETIYPESVLARLLPHFKFYTERGIPIEALHRLRAGLAMSGKLYKRIVFPIFNSEFKIVGFSGRYIGEELGDRPKWKHLGKKKNWVYPLYCKNDEGLFTREAILKNKEVILVESIGDLLAFHTRGIFNVLCCFGLNVSPAIVFALMELDPERIILALNNDENKGENNTGRIAAINNFLFLLTYFDYSSIGIALPVKKDFGEMNDVDFRAWLEIKASTDFDKQRNALCEEITLLKERDQLSDKALRNLRVLDC